MNPPLKLVSIRIDSSKYNLTPTNGSLAKTDKKFLKLLNENGIVTQKFGSEPEYSSYDAPAFSNTKFFDKLFDLYRDSSNEEKVILDVIKSVTLRMCKSRERALYIGSTGGIHPAELSKLFGEVVVMNKYGPEGDLLSRLETNINNNPDYSQNSFTALVVSHSHYFLEPSKHGQLNEMLNYLMKAGAPQHLVMHRHSGQTNQVVTDLGGTPGDGLNVGGMAELIDNRRTSIHGRIKHVRAQVIISAVELLAMMHKVGFLLLDTGAIVEAAILSDYVERHLKNGKRYSISRDDEHFIFKTSWKP